MTNNRIKKYRTKQGISIAELSRKAGISERIYMSFRKRHKN